MLENEEYKTLEQEHTTQRSFLLQLERLIEAVYIIRLQYDEAKKNG